MKRHEMLRHVAAAFRSHFVICYLGSASEELFASGDHPRFFYVLGSMGLASSIGLGLALVAKGSVLAFEGDGSVLMNLGALITAAQRAPSNYVLVLLDNHQHAATGGQPTATARGLDLAILARSVGFRTVISCRTLDDIANAARTTARPLLIHAIVEPGDGPRRIVDLEPAELAARFRRAVAADPG